MIDKNDKFFNYVMSNYSFEDRYNSDAASSVLGEHLGILKILLENLKLASSQFFTTSANAGCDFRYFIKINDQRYIEIKMSKNHPDYCEFSFLNFRSDDIDKVGELKMDLTKSLTSDDIKDQFKIGVHYIETGEYSLTPVDRFTFNSGARRFGKRRSA